MANTRRSLYGSRRRSGRGSPPSSPSAGGQARGWSTTPIPTTPTPASGGGGGGATPASGGGGAAGKAASGMGKWGKRLLIGGGWLGTAWMALELLGLLKEAAEDKQGQETRRIGGETWAEDLMTGGSRSLEDRLASSQRFARRARDRREINPGMSRELQALIEGREKELSGMTQKVKPSIREAYARHGLIS